MAREGYNYASPSEPNDSFNRANEGEVDLLAGQGLSEPDAERPTEQERQIAVQDATCKEDTLFWAAWNGAVEHAEAIVVTNQRPRIDRVLAARARMLSNAAALASR